MMWPRYEFTVPEQKRVRFICHTDAKNEADDQFTIAHVLMTDFLDVRGIVGAHFATRDAFPGEGLTVKESMREIEKILGLMGLADSCSIFEGAGLPLADMHTPRDSAGARFIIEEAMRDDERPLFIGLQGSLTDLASAILMEPAICRRMTAIWIGGGAYPTGGVEFNLSQDIHAANVLFSSEMEVWQVPVNAYRQFSVSLAELQLKVRPCGRIGAYLFRQMEELNRAYAENAAWPHGETWSLGDEGVISVLLENSEDYDDVYEIRERPLFNPDMTYRPGEGRGTVRVYKRMNARLDLEDLFAKLALNYRHEADAGAAIRAAQPADAGAYIRAAQPADLPAIMEIYSYAREFMAAHGNPNQWGPTNWPPEALIREDIAAGKSFVCENGGEITGVFYFDCGPDIEPSYRVIENGAWRKDAPYGVIHRIASAKNARGVGHAAVAWALERCGYLRIDTHPDNVVMQRFLEKEGFVRCGIIHVPQDEYPRFAYEK